ncbi:BTB/POZ DOMAIN-CONTAINING ADAPTER FOR CUL3-MEDIATED RHOA DEGRADATION PROTEIN FAMILY MEMBER [Salix viminalis]|uniref:BTB/POZ DOMAIN-CONTAINING ADAPTER FOR CUL3-MEDIATED RHOA DEGRADATION PROTEIN FAMILY MEMBER n=1 Tax=Salix viminalis TaxID=40686 RepID=A0A9Q0YYC3_SALVM|nr:BTB/POZ DOMAIN-CONTAINING ADAPTER FOR CUL3-MEDIATED RHOA DEGRADATION PROTEIN FAMILY MEMBER [Salix viminalis]
MPTFTTTTIMSSQSNNLNIHRLKINPNTQSNIVTINVGGQIFQTTDQTLTLAGPKSLFSQLSEFSPLGPHFIDRDPDLFSILLSLLRTGNLPSKAKSYDLQDLIEESKFYRIESLLVDSLSNPSRFDPFNLQKTLILPLNSRDTASAITATPHGALHVSHGSKITSFDWSLQNKSTTLTQFSAIDSMLAISPILVAVGATDFSGLQILDLEKKGLVLETLNWENVTKSGSTTLSPVTEIAHYEIFGADLDSAIPATKLKWVESYNVLMASGSHSGPSGVLGNVKFWDIRSGCVVWEFKEKVDCFSDITVSDNLSSIFKVGVNSGEVFYADLRKLASEGNDSWVCLGDERKVGNVRKEGVGCKIEAHGNQVFCSKGGDIELWSEVVMDSSKKRDEGLPERVFRKNLMGRVKDMVGSRVTNLAFGGNKMFVTWKDQQSVEVWQSSVRGF